MKKRIKYISILLLLIIFSLMGVSHINKTRILSLDKFTSIVNKESLKTVNVKEQLENETIKDAIVAYNKYGDYQIEYIIFNDIESAKSAFLINKNEFKTFKDENTLENNTNKKNSSIYELTTNDKYMYISRINNSLIYINTDITYIEEAKNIIEKLNY